MQYDLVILGNDEAAFEVAEQSVRAGLRVGCFLPARHHSAWVMNRALNSLNSELLVDMNGRRQQFLTERRSPRLLKRLLTKAVVEEISGLSQDLQEIGCEVHVGDPLFVDERRLEWIEQDKVTPIESRHFVIATGIRHEMMQSEFGRRCFRPPMSLFRGHQLPSQLIVLGGDDFGAGLATLMSLFGIQTRLVARRDPESTALELAYATGVHIGHHPSEVGLHNDVQLLEDHATVVDCRRAIGFTDHLHLQATGIEPDEYGQLWCASNFETWCPGIFGVGEVVGFSPESALQTTIQAKRVLERMATPVPRPHRMRRNSPAIYAH